MFATITVFALPPRESKTIREIQLSENGNGNAKTMSFPDGKSFSWHVDQRQRAKIKRQFSLSCSFSLFKSTLRCTLGPTYNEQFNS